jgi:hypothetical protein
MLLTSINNNVMAFKINTSVLASVAEVKTASVRATKSLASATKEVQNLISFIINPEACIFSPWLKDDGTVSASVEATAISLDGKITKEITFHVIDSELLVDMQEAGQPIVVSAAFGKKETNKDKLYAVRFEIAEAEEEEEVVKIEEKAAEVRPARRAR